MKRIGALLLLLFLAASYGMPYDLPKAVKKIAETQPEHRLKIQEGISHFDAGRLQEALDCFQSVLKENPEDPTALYEMAYTLAQQKEYAKAEQVLLRLLTYDWNNRVSVCTVLGNLLDTMERPADALDVYRKALREFPQNQGLRFNLAVTLANMKKHKEAREELEKSLALGPQHPGTLLLLGISCAKGNQRLPALLSLGQFLILEPHSGRSGLARQTFLDVYGSFMTQTVGKDGKPTFEIHMSSPGNEKEEENNLYLCEVLFSIALAAQNSEARGKESPFRQMVNVFNILADHFAGMKITKESPILLRHFALFYSGIKKNGHTEAFVAQILEDTNDKESAEWRQQNTVRMGYFVSWAKDFSFASAP